jgi:hypothetical protein
MILLGIHILLTRFCDAFAKKRIGLGQAFSTGLNPGKYKDKLHSVFVMVHRES